VTASLIGQLPVGVRLGTSEARGASLRFDAPSDAPARAAPTTEFGFDDFLDLINPLQHLPIIGTLYRAWTGDEISGPARILGDALYGGPLGLAFGVFDAIVEDATGKDVGGNIYAAAFGEETPIAEEPPVALASTAATVPEPAAAPMQPPALPATPVESTIAAPPAPPAITGYQEALDAMSSALDRYQSEESRMPTVDASY
jgi:hypothetical protein